MGMMIAVLSLLLGMGIFLFIPYSPSVSRFHRICAEKISMLEKTTALFSEDDIAGLPLPVQNYFRYCGYLGTPKMTYMKAWLKNVDFVMSENKTLKIDYQQLNLAARPERLALITSSLLGIPFEGLDSYEGGKGHMKGILAKVIPLFDQGGESMDRSSLVTWLAECLLLPSAALQDFVSWEAIDDTHAAAPVTWQGMSVSGIFTFSAKGELLAFRTSDRVAVDMKGEETIADWSAFFLDYHLVNQLRQPQVIQSLWHYEQGDSVYFNENRSPFCIQY